MFLRYCMYVGPSPLVGPLQFCHHSPQRPSVFVYGQHPYRTYMVVLYSYIYIYTCVYMHVCPYACTCVFAHTCHVSVHIYIHICMTVYVYNIHTRAYVLICVYRERETKRESAKFKDTIHTPGGTRDQSLSPVTPKQTFLCDVKPWSSLEPMPFGIVAFSNAS